MSDNPATAPALTRTPIKTPIKEGITLLAGALDVAQQKSLLEDIRKVTATAPLYTPTMPRTGKAWTVRMTNCGELGWVSDQAGYRYQATHPVTNKPWPPIPPALLELWDQATGYKAPPECCLVNFYGDKARMGLHRDEDEQALDAPVLSVSLGDTATFRVGGLTRKDKTQSLKLHSGDIVLIGSPNRLAYHGIDRTFPGTSTLLKDGGRLNLTLRRVTKP